MEEYLSPREPELQAGQKGSPGAPPWGGSVKERYQLLGVLEELSETCWGKDLLGTPEVLRTVRLLAVW